MQGRTVTLTDDQIEVVKKAVMHHLDNEMLSAADQAHCQKTLEAIDNADAVEVHEG